MVKLLLKIGKTDIKQKDKNNQTLLLQAIEGGYKAIVKLLLKAGVKANCEYSIYISKLALNLVYTSIKLIANPSIFSCYKV